MFVMEYKTLKLTGSILLNIKRTFKNKIYGFENEKNNTLHYFLL